METIDVLTGQVSDLGGLPTVLGLFAMVLSPPSDHRKLIQIDSHGELYIDDDPGLHLQAQLPRAVVREIGGISPCHVGSVQFSVAGKRVRLRVITSDAVLFSFQFVAR
jgi:hypothetical protein